MRATVLLIEDEIDILEVVEYNLTHEGYRVVKSLDGESGLILAREKNPDLVLLDRMLPGLDGTEVCRHLKEDPLTRDIPVIMLTAKSEEDDVVLGLALGADDYIKKPFRPKELLARIAAVLRRSKVHRSASGESRLEVAGIVIDPLRHEVVADDARVDLTATEFRILRMLATHPGRVFSREQIASKALDQILHSTDRNIDVHIKTIRKKLGERRDAIETVRGVGYRFCDRHPN